MKSWLNFGGILSAGARQLFALRRLYIDGISNSFETEGNSFETEGNNLLNLETEKLHQSFAAQKRLRS